MTSIPDPGPQIPNPVALPLLLEIGCEEIPARFLAAAQKDFGEHLRQALTEAGLLAGAVREPPLQTYSTPRRLVVYAPEVLEKQPEKVEEVRGPAVRAAFDAQGNPTRAAQSFAAKNGATAQELVRVSTPKGEYVAVRKSVAGKPAFEVLPEILSRAVTGLTFPRSMYWEKSKTRFIRPIRWTLALLGAGEQGRVVPFDIAGVKSGTVTYGHRIMDSRPISVKGFKDYSDQLRESLVEPDPEKRRQKLRSEVKALLEGSFLNVIEDKELEEWVVNSTEWPRALLGSFEGRFLKLPQEILITVMRDHQKYFAVASQAKDLQPYFIALLNMPGDEKGLIRAGHERVLTARFSDAEFFWNADQRIALSDRLPILERVTYQAKLGSYGAKVRRMEAIADTACRTLGDQGMMSTTDTEHVLRAARLCKCDLTTQMVQEFTELQGVVGGLYAAAQGEPEPVSAAIYDHYLPVSLEGESPRTVIAAVVSLADKLDSVIAGFSASLQPTGSSDPFGLRRAGNGIIKLCVDLLPRLDLLELLKEIVQANLCLPPVADLLGQTAGFLRERAESYLETVAGLRYDTVRAVVQSFLAWQVPADALARGRALERIRDSDDFVALSTASRRTRNILDKSAKPEDLIESSEPVKEELLKAGPEEELYSAYNRLRPTLDDLAAHGRYEEAFRVLAGLRPQVDRFFDKVLVMDNDVRVRRNRLNVLSKLDLWVFKRFADLSQIESVTSSSVDASTSQGQ